MYQIIFPQDWQYHEVSRDYIIIAKCLMASYSTLSYIFIVHFMYCKEVYCSGIGVYLSPLIIIIIPMLFSY